MRNARRYMLLLTILIVPSAILIAQQIRLGGRLTSLQVHERDTRVRRAIDDFVEQMLATYDEQNRVIAERLVSVSDLRQMAARTTPDSFLRLPELRSQFSRPLLLFVARPVFSDRRPEVSLFALRIQEIPDFEIEYFALNDEDELTSFTDHLLAPVHRATLTFLHTMIVSSLAFRDELEARLPYASSGQSGAGYMHFFQVPLYRDDPVIPQYYAGFCDSAQLALHAFMRPYLRSDVLTAALRNEGLDPEELIVQFTGRDGAQLYSSQDAPIGTRVLEVPLSAYGELFAPYVVRASTVQGSGQSAEGLWQRQGTWILLIAGAWLIGATLLMVQTAARDRTLVRVQSDFVGRISHELKTPVAVLMNAVDTLRNPKVQNAADLQKCTDIIRTRVRELAELLEKLLAVCRMDVDRVSIAPEPMDLGAHVREVAPRICEDVGLSPTISVRAYDADVTALGGQRDASVSAYADATAVDLILRNLLENVAKHAGDENADRVEITCMGSPRWAVLGIRDWGKGIPRRERRRIFRRFHRVTEGLRMSAPGHGLGLALVKDLAEAHGGTAWVESQPGRGSTFFVRFPRRPPS